MSDRPISGRTPLILGAHLIPERLHHRLPAEAIIINLEPLETAEHGFIRPEYLRLLKSRRVIDCSQINCTALLREGARAVHMALGHSGVLERIQPALVQDTDVLFYGSVTPRRRAVLETIHRTGVKLVCLFGVYGAERDAHIARAKIVLTLRSFATNPADIVRMAYLMNNRVCVVSEDRPDDPDLAPLREGMRLVQYNQLAAECGQLLGRPGERHRTADEGYRLLRARPQSELLATALEALSAL